MRTHGKQRRAVSVVAVMAVLGLSGAARAESAESISKVQPRDRGAGFAGAKLGAYLPQAFSPLGASFFAEVEGGYLLPFFRRVLSVSASFGFTMPQIEGTSLADPRVAGGGYSYSQPSQQFILGLTVLANIALGPLGRFVPYVGVGPRYSIVRTPSTGLATGGATIEESLETSRQVGVGVPLGLNVVLGPGRLFAEGQLLWAQSPQRSTGAASFGSLAASAGYRLVF